jgi:tRNA-dihydrouridine synthase 1
LLQFRSRTFFKMAVQEGVQTPAATDGLKDAAPTRTKLTGRQFYESLGSPRFIVAPMVDRSEFVGYRPCCCMRRTNSLQAWRMLTRSFMTKGDSKPLLAYSPMFHARLFKENPGFRSQFFQPTRHTAGGNELAFLDGNPAIDRPLFVQFCANNPDDFLEAALHVAPHCDAVDLNLGCPQGIARKGHYGAFLQEDWDLIYKLINKLHTELPVPVTAKFRIQETKEKTLEYAKMILSAGASIITVHGRRREQKGHNTGIADWSYIRYLRDNLPPETVIFANGNILNHGDIEQCLQATGADSVMSAEGNLSDPTIFGEVPAAGSEGREYWRDRNDRGGYRMDAIFRRYLDIIHQYVLETPVPERRPLYLPSDPDQEKIATTDVPIDKEEDTEDGPPKKKQKRTKEKKPRDPNLVAMQGHLFQLLRPLVSKHTNIRDVLARTQAGDIAAFEKILSMVEDAVKEGIHEYEKFPERFDAPKTDGEKLEGSKATIAEYGRPWWVCQPYVRPLPAEAIAIGAMKVSKKNQKAKETEANDKPTTLVAIDSNPFDSEPLKDLFVSSAPKATVTEQVDALVQG